MSLMATQLGTKKKVASTTTKITVPAMESYVVPENKKWELKHTPKVAPTEIYVLNGDSTFGVKYACGTSDATKQFSIAGKTISLPTEIAVGTEVFIMYEYDTDQAVEVVNSAKNFPVGCKFIMEVLGCDVCDQTNMQAA